MRQRVYFGQHDKQQQQQRGWQHSTSNKRAVSPALLSQPVPLISTRCTAPVSKPKMLQSMLVSTLSYRLSRDLRAAVATASNSPADCISHCCVCVEIRGRCKLSGLVRKAWQGQTWSCIVKLLPDQCQQSVPKRAVRKACVCIATVWATFVGSKEASLCGGVAID